MGKHRKFIRVPFWIVEPLAALLQRFEFFPFTTDQLVMLREENIIHDPKNEREWRETFNLPMKRFATGVEKALSGL
jgi:hypothetical protein